MKILQMFGEPVSHGGQEAFVINMLTHMPSDGMCIDVLTPYYCDNEHYRDIIESRGGKLYCLGMKFEPGGSRLNLIAPLKKFLSGHGYDVIHIHSGSTSVLAEGARAAQSAGIKKIIVHSHCAAEKFTLRHAAVKFVMNAVMFGCPTHYAACSLIAGQSKYPRRIVKRRLIILKNGVDIQKFSFNAQMRSYMRGRLNIPENAVVLGHVGRFSYQKNHEYLLSVLAAVRIRGIDAKLMLIGSGENMQNVISLAQKLGLSQHVMFIGNVNNVNDYMQAMDVFLLPSRFEGLPIVGVEAQAVGLPCIFSSAVTNEVALTSNVCYLPADGASVGLWADKVLQFADKWGADNTAALKNAGFDVCRTADILRDIYFS